MKCPGVYIKLNALVRVVYLSTGLNHLFKAPKHFGVYIILNTLKTYIIVNAPVHVIYVRHWGRLYMYNTNEVMLFTMFMHMLWFK